MIRDDFEYIKDYIEHFIKWYAERTQYYMSDKLIIKINHRLRYKYGYDAATQGPLKPNQLNRRFGFFAEGPYCRVHLYDVKPMVSDHCMCCGEMQDAYEAGRNHRHDFDELSEYNPEEHNDSGDYTKINKRHNNYIDDLAHIDPLRERSIYHFSLCDDPICKKLNAWLRRETEDFARARELLIKCITPTKAAIDKQTGKYRRPYLVSRYLDFKARLKFAEDRLTASGY